MLKILALPLSIICASMTAQAVFIDGSGSYGLLGETRTKPGFSGDTGNYQAIEQYFRFESELRVSDDASFFLEFDLFGDRRESYFGDSSRGTSCTQEQIDSGDCIESQSSLEPRYQPYQPSVTAAYAKFSTEYCLLTVGRRPRDWGLGMYLDSGKDVFDTDASFYDGITCDINIQKSQTLGFSVGYDKITETGASPFANPSSDTDTFGATNRSDDLDQLFFTLEYNTHKINAGKGFSQQIGIYFANIFGGENTKTDIKIADLYVNFLVSDLLIQNEFLFRLGESSDPNLKLLGGARGTNDDNEIRNNVQSIAVAGNIEYFLSKVGNNTGPLGEESTGSKSHSLFFEYAYAPGDADGYFAEQASSGLENLRDTDVGAVAFHQNFKPGLILFNGKRSTDALRVDGAFDPFRVMNATVLSLGYRYKSFDYGDLEIKVLTASLNEAIPDEAITAIDSSGTSAVGYGGTDLGTELDVTYERSLGKGFRLGIAAGIASPGDAWKTNADADTELNYLLQSQLSFSF
ncbi:MAG: hypothetical protein HRU19_07375 [Pseudobacteriovorax sp.]|nr:hypothetical protein [Pseudobacteriovorax sp.]